MFAELRELLRSGAIRRYHHKNKIRFIRIPEKQGGKNENEKITGIISLIVSRSWE